MEGDQKFFAITKKMHNMLQGKSGELSKEEIDYYLDVNRRNAEQLNEEFDIVVVHDPQPMALPFLLSIKRDTSYGAAI